MSIKHKFFISILFNKKFKKNPKKHTNVSNLTDMNYLNSLLLTNIILAKSKLFINISNI